MGLQRLKCLVGAHDWGVAWVHAETDYAAHRKGDGCGTVCVACRYRPEWGVA